MDIGHINKVTDRKRLLDEIQRVGAKVSKENVEAVKLQIANDTAFWEMKEKLAQKESEHEQLKQNMAALQMQHEALSAQYQEELRMRPEVLNKLNANRKIYQVLEKEMERVMRSVSRAKADKAALYDAYMKADQVVRDLKQKHIQEVEKGRHTIEALERTAAASSEHQRQLAQVLAAREQLAEADRRELRRSLDAALGAKDQLAGTVVDITRKLDMVQLDIEKRDETISTLQRDTKDMINSFNGQVAEARAILDKKDKELKSNAAEIELLKGALANQEAFANEACERSGCLLETLADLEDKYQKATAANDGLKVRIEEMTAKNEKLNSDITLFKEGNEGLVKELNDKCQVLSMYEEDFKKLIEQISAKDEQNKELSVRLNDTLEESINKSEQVHSLTFEIGALTKDIANMEAAFKNYREAAEDKHNKQAATIEERTKELDAKVAAVIRMGLELQHSAEELARLEHELQTVKAERDLEVANAEEAKATFTTKLSQLEAMVKGKDEELSLQMCKFLEMRNESEREKALLREKHNALKLKLDNIRMETADETRAPPDDHAVVTADHGRIALLRRDSFEDMLSSSDPCDGDSLDVSTATIILPRAPERPPALRRDSFEDMLSSSDPCDGDSLDSQEISRRFAALARGQPLPPVPHAMLKRRRKDAPGARHCAAVARPQPQPQPQPQLQMPSTIGRAENVQKERRFFKSVNDGKIQKRK